MDGHAPLPAPLHPQPDWVKRRRLDVAEYHRMAEAGILRPEDRVELIEGELIAMSPAGGAHILRVMRLNRLLGAAVGDRALVSVQSNVRLGEFSEPEPDLALVRPTYDGAAPPLAAELLLVIEVSDSSLRYDRTTKAALYAQHGIAEYWIVDVAAKAVTVHRAPREGAYAWIRQVAPEDVVEPVLLPGLRLAVADLLG
jgi:Uma2 family endonuclease